MKPIGPKPLTAVQVIALMIATVGFVALADAALNMPPEHAHHFKPLPPIAEAGPHTGRQAIAYLFAAPYDDAGYTVAEYEAKQRDAVRVLRAESKPHVKAKPSMWAALDGGSRE